MKFAPYPEQQAAIDHCINWLRGAKSGDKCIVAGPTGCGKSVVEAAVQAEFPSCWIISPKDEIIDGIMDKAELTGDPMSHRLCTPVTLRNRLLQGEVSIPAQLLWDEGHHQEARTWQEVDLLTGNAPGIVFTATPYRGSPRSTREFRERWGDPLWMITYQEAAELGRISVPEFAMLPLVDDDVVEVQGGDFSVTSIDSATVDRLGDLAEHSKLWHRNGLWDRPTIYACPSTACCVRLKQELLARGLPCEIVNASTKDRRTIFQAVERRIVALLHINIVTEGVDLKLRRLVDLAPTLSPVKWVQQLGRVTRPTGWWCLGCGAMGKEHFECCGKVDREPPPYYVCIAEGTPIFTDRGWVPIQAVRSTDLVWDGEEFVQHDGVVCNGIREVIDVHGVLMTPDHKVLTEEGWVKGCQLRRTSIPFQGNRSVDGKLFLPSDVDANADVRAELLRAFRLRGSSEVAQQDASHAENSVRNRNMTGRGSLQSCQRGSSICGECGSAPCSDARRSTTPCGVLRCTKRGSIIRRACSLTSSHSKVGAILRSRSTGSTTMATMNPVMYGSLLARSRCRTHGNSRISTQSSRITSSMDSRGACISSSNGAFTSIGLRSSTEYPGASYARVYDILNCGPRYRYQAGGLIVSNCTNRNIMRHAYALEGLVPIPKLAEAESSFKPTDRGHSARAFGLEAIGRFKPTTVKLLNGLTVHMYNLSVMVDNLMVQYCCLVHPAREEPIWASQVHRKDGEVMQWGRWVACDAPTDLRGFGSRPERQPSEKQIAWWNRSAAARGLDPQQKLDKKNFAVLPVLFDLGERFT